MLKQGDGTQVHAAGTDVSTKSTCQTKMCFKTKVRHGLCKKAVKMISPNSEICKSWSQFQCFLAQKDLNRKLCVCTCDAYALCISTYNMTKF